jgi:hypothetical protein
MAKNLHTTAAVRDAFVSLLRSDDDAMFQSSCPDGHAAIETMQGDFLGLLGGMGGVW